MATRFHHINFASRRLREPEKFYRNVLELDESHAHDPATGATPQIKDQGYGGRVAFLMDGAVEAHLSTQDPNVSFRTGKAINPLANTLDASCTAPIRAARRKSASATAGSPR